MAHWREEYLAALAARDHREKAKLALYNAFSNAIVLDTQLADRTAQTATAGNNAPVSGTPGAQGSQPSSPALDPRKRASRSPENSLQEILTTTRAELSEAQRSRSELQDQLTRTTVELEKLRKKSTQNTRRIGSLENKVAHLQLRLKDRDEELRGKAKLLDVWCHRLPCLIILAHR
ncbi:autophagy protein 16, interacts with Atg12p-Atg5p [Aspergillus melleus]|uniref:autophagy protein 16, interacts with Atg12p-Atg5p n=1 Tax=Aspergillus melleus TaxID=138277 RepID=UPI001E8D750F|nr:autophagy protein 16, interacts with Atg12p-Atg5p [Aspergillus melleus]KAH8425329.1 autophagy protein 16, interacts with Atg12p-Atg5p [Aspergillus melleus]